MSLLIYLLIGVAVCAFIFFVILIAGLRAGLYFMFNEPEAVMLKWNPDATITEYKVDTMGENKWKLDSDDPQKIKFNVKVGMFKIIPMECDRNDYQEIHRAGGKGKVFVEVGLKNRDKYMRSFLDKIMNERDFYYNMATNLQLQNEEVMANPRKSMEVFKEDYKEVHKASQVFVKAGGSK
jgi:hypothetical protein